MDRLVPVLGLAVLLGLAWCLSDARRRIDWRIVLWGLGLQFAFGWIALRTDAGRAAFRAAGDGVNALLGFSAKGAAFVFGGLATGEQPFGFVFAFQILPTIVFFSSLMSVLYHLRILEWVVRGIGIGLRNVLRVSGAEAFSAAANIFVGQTEAPFVIKPFLPRMTRSEVFCVMTGGFATVAGGVMAAYVFMFRDHPQLGSQIAGHLIAASVMSAPAALLLAKVMRPETEEPVTRGRVAIEMERPGRNVIDAAVAGARDGLLLAANVAAMLIAFVALIAMLNAGVGWVGEGGGGVGWGGSLEGGLGIVLTPLAWLMGIPWAEAGTVGELVGVKTVLNEFLAYQGLADLPPGTLSARSMAIATYALCGFSNFGSIAIQVGGIGAMVPSQRDTLARHGLPAMVAGSFACFMTACVAALLL